MELTEAFRRVVLRHKGIIVLCILLGAAVPIGSSYLRSPTYTASARLVLNAPDPADEAESTALADAAEAIATSPSYVTTELNAEDITTDPIVFARDNIHVRALGTSGVLELSVTTGDPDTAAAIANRLADKLIEVRTTYGDSLASRLEELQKRQEALAATIDDPSTLPAEREDARLTKQSVEAELDSVRTAIAERPQAQIIDPATPPVAADTSARVTETALGILLGLILGVGLAAFAELLRPTVAGAAAVARTLGSRVLGSAPRVGDRFAPIDPTDPMVVRLRLAAAAESVTTIEVLAVPSGLSATSLAYRLEEALAAAGPRGRTRRSLTVRAFGLEAAPGLEGPSAAVVVAEPSIPQKELDAAHDLLSLAELPVLGVIVADRPRRRGRKRREAAMRAKPERATTDQLVVLPNEAETAPGRGDPEGPVPSPVRPVRPARPARPVRKAAATGSTRVSYAPAPAAGTRLGSGHPSVVSAGAREDEAPHVVSSGPHAVPEPETVATPDEMGERGEVRPEPVRSDQPEREAPKAENEDTEEERIEEVEHAPPPIPVETAVVSDASAQESEPVEASETPHVETPDVETPEVEPSEGATNAGSELAFQPAPRETRRRRPAPKKSAAPAIDPASQDPEHGPDTGAGGRASAR